MKKTIILLSLLLGISCLSSAQSYQKGDNLVNVGVSLGFGALPLNASFEKGITDDISVGPTAGVIFYPGSAALNLGARGSYHFNKILDLNNDKIDLYGGLGVGYVLAVSSRSLIGFGPGFYPALHLGGRYYLSPKLGVFGEAGYGTGYLNGGLTFKL